MTYFAISDIHSYYAPMMEALRGAGFDSGNPEHCLVICGDLFDRGQQAREVAAYVEDLLARGRVILIRGNHEDLLEDAVSQMEDGFGEELFWSHHKYNGTLDTICQITGKSPGRICDSPELLAKIMRRSAVMSELLPAMVDYYETPHYIFTHGWIPTFTEIERRAGGVRKFLPHYLPAWREATPEMWKDARWLNGMEMALQRHIIEPGKIIVCGHWHTSWGHALLDGTPESGEGADFSPVAGEGILALDASTAYSKRVNCVVLTD